MLKCITTRYPHYIPYEITVDFIHPIVCDFTKKFLMCYKTAGLYNRAINILLDDDEKFKILITSIQIRKC